MASSITSTTMSSDHAEPRLPRVAITFCTQCRWMLRAAYFAQELLSTFSTAIGEVALIPATGGIFQVHLTHIPQIATGEEGSFQAQEVLLWDRKAEGGFPETKILKQRLRNYIDPGKDLGHSDKPSTLQQAENAIEKKSVVSIEQPKASEKDCEDCK